MIPNATTPQLTTQTWPRHTHYELYPFVPKRFTQPNGLQQAYLDEGPADAEPIVFVHGNPTWSFYFRRMILALRDRYRCLAPDHIGCGNSDQPADHTYDFSLTSRINDLDRLLESVNPTKPVTLFVQDWGGMIGLSWAARHPTRVKRIIASNTGAFPLPRTKRFPYSLWLGRNTALGGWLILRHNLFCRIAARWCVTRQTLPAEVRSLYLAPHDTPEHRLSTLKFVQTIPLAPSDPGWYIITDTASKLQTFAKARTPTLLLWGMKDFVFDRHFLEEFQHRLPQAQAHTWPDCGHYLLEDAFEEVLPKVETFLQTDSDKA